MTGLQEGNNVETNPLKHRRKASLEWVREERERLRHSPCYYQFAPSNHLIASWQHRKRFREQDLDYFRIYFAPAAGPSAFVSAGFEKRLRYLMKENKLTSQKWMVGGSTGALRFLALVSGLILDRDVTQELKDHYCNMVYKNGDTPAVLRPMMEELYEICARDEVIEDLLSHSQFRFAILVAKMSSDYSNLSDTALKFIFFRSFVNQMVQGPKALRSLCSRLCFYTGPEPPTFLQDGIGGADHIEYVPLTRKNLRQVLHATTGVPFVQERCEFIHGVGHGLFMDGALTDYSLNVCLHDSEMPALLLADTFNGAVFGSVFDHLSPLKPQVPQEFFNHCSLIYPLETLCQVAPIEKKKNKTELPSVQDWFKKEYIRDPKLREKHWNHFYSLSLEYWHLALDLAHIHFEQMIY